MTKHEYANRAKHEYANRAHRNEQSSTTTLSLVLLSIVSFGLRWQLSTIRVMSKFLNLSISKSAQHKMT